MCGFNNDQLMTNLLSFAFIAIICTSHYSKSNLYHIVSYTHTYINAYTCLYICVCANLYTHIYIIRKVEKLYILYIFDTVSLKDKEFLKMTLKISIILNIIKYVISVQISLIVFF